MSLESVHPNTWVMVALASLAFGVILLVAYLRLRQRWTQLSAMLASVSHDLVEAQTHDKLTGLLTPSRFEAVLEDVLQRADAQGRSVCVLYFDIDLFRAINEAYGVAAGDRVLKEVAKRLRTCFRDANTSTRIVGNEFACIVRGGLAVGKEAASAFAAALAAPISIAPGEVRLTCSIGIASYPEQDARHNIISMAASAMGAVKLKGGAGLAQYDPQDEGKLRENALLLHDLRGAVERRELVLHYQPKVDASSLQITAAEVLIRWRHPLRGMVSPETFIPLAERYGLIRSIGRWVIEEACRQSAVWREQGLRMRMAVNISSDQMRQDDFVEHLQATLAKSNIPPARFTCEITESVAMEDTSATKHTFERLRQLGVHVSIDDFGTGHSSLASLKNLPAAELKIDRAFVTDLETSEHARYIANTIVQMAHALNMRVVAEGVETNQQRDLLVGMGCDELQGYLFSRPMPAQELARWSARDHANADSDADADFRPSLYSETSLSPLR
jgi:diguanylate cyclase (GGDEF)-like protein